MELWERQEPADQRLFEMILMYNYTTHQTTSSSPVESINKVSTLKCDYAADDCLRVEKTEKKLKCISGCTWLEGDNV